jgi:hypothetical protein
MGEVAYDYGDKDFVGRTPNESMLGKSPFYLINAARWCHMSGLCWVGDYGPYQQRASQDKPPQFGMGWEWKFLINPEQQEEILKGAELVQKNLGYRFVMLKAEFPASVKPGEEWTMEFQVRNDGSAPFYYDWKVQAALLGPDNKPVWTGVFSQTDIRKWQPGHGLEGAVYPFPESWGEAVQPYVNPPNAVTEVGSFQMPADIAPGVYTLAISILDPGGNVPSMRFANWNYFEGGHHPLGRVSVGVPIGNPGLGAEAVRSPSRDQSLFYKL